MSSDFYYYIVKFNSVVDSNSSYRFAMRPNNSKTQLIGLSEAYKSYEAAHDAMNHFREFVTDDIRKEAETLDMVRKDEAETEHLKVWMSGRRSDIARYMFHINDGENVLLTSAQDYEHKMNCINGLKTVLEHAQCDLEDCEDPADLGFEASLDSEHEVGLMLTNFGQSVLMHVTEITYEKSVLMVFTGFVNGRTASFL